MHGFGQATLLAIDGCPCTLGMSAHANLAIFPIGTAGIDTARALAVVRGAVGIGVHE